MKESNKTEHIIGNILIVLGFISVLYNYMNNITAENIMQQGVYSTKIVANWLMVISGILLVKK